MKNTSLKNNYLYNILYQILVIIVPLITSPYLTRVLGAEKLGIYSYTQAYAHYFVLFIMLGLNNYGNREIAKNRDSKSDVSRTFWEIYCFQAFSLVFLSLLYASSIIFIVKENRSIYWLQFIYVISAGLDINWCCFGLEKFKLTVTRNSIIKIASAVCIFVFVKTPNDLWIYTLLIAGSSLLSQIIIWPFILKEIKFVKPTLKGVISRIKPNLMLFLPVIAVSLYTIMDKLMLGMMDTKTEVGYYSYAERIIQIPQAFITALGTVMLPRISNMLKNGKDRMSDILLGRSMQYAMFISIGSAAGVMAIAKELIPWYYGAEFIRCSLFTAWLAPVIVFTSWNTIIRTQYVIPKGYDKIYLFTVSSGAVVNLILNYFLIETYRGTGAVIATILAQLVVCLAQYLLLRKEIDYKVFVSDTVAFLIIGTVMGLCVAAIPDFLAKDILGILMKIVIGIVLYVFLSWVYLIHIKHDRWMFDSIMKMLSIRKRR